MTSTSRWQTTTLAALLPVLLALVAGACSGGDLDRLALEAEGDDDNDNDNDNDNDPPVPSPPGCEQCQAEYEECAGKEPTDPTDGDDPDGEPRKECEIRLAECLQQCTPTCEYLCQVDFEGCVAECSGPDSPQAEQCKIALDECLHECAGCGEDDPADDNGEPKDPPEDPTDPADPGNDGVG